MRAFRRSVWPIIACSMLAASGCDDDDGDGGNPPGPGPIRLLAASQGPAALELVDAQTLELAFDSPLPLDDPPLEARVDGDGELVVTTFAPPVSARSFDAPLFEEEPESELGPGARAAFEDERDRVHLAGESLAVFDTRTFVQIFRGVDLAGVATDVVHDERTGRVFVAVTGERALLQVFDADDLSVVPPSPLELGGPGSTTGDLLLVGDRGEVWVALPSESRLAVRDAANLRELARTPIELRIPASELARDERIARIYGAASDGRLEAVSATTFALEGGFPRDVARSVSDLAYEPATQQLVVADSAAERLVVLDGLTLDEEPDSPVVLEGAPVSVEVMDLRSD